MAATLTRNISTDELDDIMANVAERLRLAVAESLEDLNFILEATSDDNVGAGLVIRGSGGVVTPAQTLDPAKSGIGLAITATDAKKYSGPATKIKNHLERLTTGTQTTADAMTTLRPFLRRRQGGVGGMNFPR